MSIKALFLNCTVKRSPQMSNTQLLIDKVAGLMTDLGAECETVRVLDYNVAYGTASDMGGDDEWPAILSKIVDADILVLGMPIWMGVRSSVCQLVIERLDGTYDEGDAELGHYPLYGKVGGVIVTGNEDGAHDCASNTLYNLTHFGCTIAPNSDCYWVGDAGAGPSYGEIGDGHLYTNRTARYLAHNTVWMASILAENPCPTSLRALDAEAKLYSDGVDQREARIAARRAETQT